MILFLPVDAVFRLLDGSRRRPSWQVAARVFDTARQGVAAPVASMIGVAGPERKGLVDEIQAGSRRRLTAWAPPKGRPPPHAFSSIIF
jgi:hypothetical protein